MGPRHLLDALDEGPARRTSDVAATQRRRMLAGMITAVAEKGYANVVVADVIQRARVSRATFYEQFDGRADCFLAAFHACVDALVADLRATDQARPLPPRDRLRQLIRSYFEGLAAFPEGARVCLVEMYAAGPDAALHRRRIQLDFVALLQQHHRAFLDAGEQVRPLELIDFELLVGGISGLATGRVAAGETASLPELTEPVVQFILTQFGARLPL